MKVFYSETLVFHPEVTRPLMCEVIACVERFVPFFPEQTIRVNFSDNGLWASVWGYGKGMEVREYAWDRLKNGELCSVSDIQDFIRCFQDIKC